MKGVRTPWDPRVGKRADIPSGPRVFSIPSNMEVHETFSMTHSTTCKVLSQEMLLFAGLRPSQYENINVRLNTVQLLVRMVAVSSVRATSNGTCEVPETRELPRVSSSARIQLLWSSEIYTSFVCTGGRGHKLTTLNASILTTQCSDSSSLSMLGCCFYQQKSSALCLRSKFA